MTPITIGIAVYFIGFLLILIAPTKRTSVFGWIAVLSAGISLSSILFALFSQELSTEFIFQHATIGGIGASFGFIADGLSLAGAALVSFAALLVFLYAQEYMSEDSSQRRFFAEMCLFAGSMTGIILSVSILQMMVFWELVGLSSFLLIGFWYARPEVAAAARRVFTLIALGDILLLSGVLIIGNIAQSWDFSAINAISVASPNGVLAVALILGGAFVKSAQVPFFFWLPWAMEGPTPVSALLHSATMVKAGAFLVLRIFPVVAVMGLESMLIGAALLTSIIAGISALAERDIKRILAYSTVAQLGFIFLALGLGDTHASLFHLISDAFYKALLFLGAGVIIHAGGSRDIFSLRRFSFRENSVVLICVGVGILGITGIPPFGAFFSKDAILDAARHHGTAVYALSLFAAFLTNAYMFRWGFLIARSVRFGPGEKNEPYREEHELFGWKTKLSMVALSGGVATFGFASFRYFDAFFYAHKPIIDPAIVATTLALVATAFLVAYSIYIRNRPDPNIFDRLLNGVPYAVAVRAFGFARGAEMAAGSSLWVARAFSIIDTRIIDGLLNGIVTVGCSFARAASFADIRIIDRTLNTSIASFIRTCRGAERFDWGIIDGIVRNTGNFFIATAHIVRLSVNGILSRYLVAFSFGTLGLIIILQLVI